MTLTFAMALVIVAFTSASIVTAAVAGRFVPASFREQERFHLRAMERHERAVRALEEARRDAELRAEIERVRWIAEADAEADAVGELRDREQRLERGHMATWLRSIGSERAGDVIAQIFRSMGYRTVSVGSEAGQARALAERGGRKTLVHWAVCDADDVIRATAVQRAYGAMRRVGAIDAVFVTMRRFSRLARAAVHELSIRVIEGDELVELALARSPFTRTAPVGPGRTRVLATSAGSSACRS